VPVGMPDSNTYEVELSRHSDCDLFINGKALHIIAFCIPDTLIKLSYSTAIYLKKLC
jgi:hypothetical protein